MEEKKDFLGRILDQLDDEDVEACPLPRGKFPASTPIGMAYVPFQVWETPYDDNVGLMRGTIFPSLDKPFIGEEAVKNAGSK